MWWFPAARYGCHSHPLGPVKWVRLGSCEARVPFWAAIFQHHSALTLPILESSGQRFFAELLSSTLQSLFSIQLIYLLFHSSVMHYFFVRSLLENTLVTIELRNLRCRLFSHFRYICRFSLTIFIWFFAWMDIFVRWLKTRVIRFSIASSQWRSCRCSWDGDLFFRQGQKERIRKVRFVSITLLPVSG